MTDIIKLDSGASDQNLEQGKPPKRSRNVLGFQRSRTGSAKRHKFDWRLLWARVGIIVILTGLWELISTSFHYQFYLSTPVDVYDQLRSWASTGTLANAVEVTLYEAVMGFLLGSVVGAILGFALARAKYLGKLFEPLILAIYAIPKIAIAPLFVLWLGIGIKTKIGVAMSLVLFLVFYNTYNGTKQIDERLCDQGRIMGANKRNVMFKLVIPQAAAWVFVGLRIALPYALTGAVVGEFITSTEGIGYLINNATSLLNTAGVFAGLFLLTVIALVLNYILAAIEGLMSRWTPQQLRDVEQKAGTPPA